MKRINNLYKNLININNIIHIYEKQIRVNTKNKFKIEKYENYLSVNFYKIYDELVNDNVIFSKYFIFLIKEPKCRIIMSQTIKDKIINKKLQHDFNLTLNPKTNIGMLKNGLDFLGYVFILKDNKLYLKIRTIIKRRFKKKLKKLFKLYNQKNINYNVLEKVHASYYGHFKEGNTYYLYKNIIKKYNLKSLK